MSELFDDRGAIPPSPSLADLLMDGLWSLCLSLAAAVIVLFGVVVFALGCFIMLPFVVLDLIRDILVPRRR
jgi:hypothetical protein